MNPAAQLRLLDPDDVADAFSLLSDWEVVRYMLFPLCSLEATEKFVREAIAPPSPGPWRSIVRAIMCSPSRILVGLCGIGIPQDSEQGELWYLLGPQFWGKGLATGAVEQLLDLGFGELGLHRLWACCLPENPASARVLEKAGLRREGHRKRDLKIHGDWKDSFLYAILAEEWSERRRNQRDPASSTL